MKKFLLVVVAMMALMPLLPSANASDAVCQEESVKTPLSVMISKDK